jgi:hypothetical protein
MKTSKITAVFLLKTFTLIGQDHKIKSCVVWKVQKGGWGKSSKLERRPPMVFGGWRFQTKNVDSGSSAGWRFKIRK